MLLHKDENGKTALMIAVEARDIEKTKALIELAKDTDNPSETLKTMLTETSNDDTTAFDHVLFCGLKGKTLIDFIDFFVALTDGVNTDQLHPMGFPPLSVAAWYGNIEAMKHLLQQCGADINFFDNINNQTALVYALKNHKEEAVSLLLEEGADGFIDALFTGNDQCLGNSFELDKCTEEMQDKISEIVLFHSCHNSFNPYIIYNLDKNLERIIKGKEGFKKHINRLHSKGSFLHNAVTEGKQNAVEYLIGEGGATPSLRNTQGESALDLAVKHGRENIVNIPLRHGACINNKNKHGFNCLIHAVSRSGEKFKAYKVWIPAKIWMLEHLLRMGAESERVLEEIKANLQGEDVEQYEGVLKVFYNHKAQLAYENAKSTENFEKIIKKETQKIVDEIETIKVSEQFNVIKDRIIAEMKENIERPNKENPLTPSEFLKELSDNGQYEDLLLFLNACGYSGCLKAIGKYRLHFMPYFYEHTSGKNEEMARQVLHELIKKYIPSIDHYNSEEQEAITMSIMNAYEKKLKEGYKEGKLSRTPDSLMPQNMEIDSDKKKEDSADKRIWACGKQQQFFYSSPPTGMVPAIKKQKVIGSSP